MSQSANPERDPTPAQPADLIREVDAVEILAGRRELSGSTRHSRIRQRLQAAVRRGDVTRYLNERARARYSRREVEVLRDELAARGVAARAITPGTHHAALRRRMDEAGLIDTATAAERACVPQSTATGWAARGLYGAQKLEGQWWFVRDLVPTSPPHGRHEAPKIVRCARCGSEHERPAWEVRNASEKDRRLYCPACWDTAGDEITAANLAAGRGRTHVVADQARTRMSDAQTRRWNAATPERRAEQRAALAGGYDTMLKSPKRRAARAAALV